MTTKRSKRESPESASAAPSANSTEIPMAPPQAVAKREEDLLTAIVEVPDEISPELDEQLRDPERGDLQNVPSEDLQIVPLLQLMQSTSPPVKGRLAEPGQFWDSAAERAADAPIHVVPIFPFTTRTRWGPMGGNNNQPLCQSPNGAMGQGEPGGDCLACPEKKRWDDGQMLGSCDQMYSIVVYVLEWRTYLLMQFSRTKYKVGRQLLRMVNASGERCFANCYLIGSRIETGAGGNEYYNFTIEVHEQTNHKRLPLKAAKFASFVAEFAKANDEFKRLHAGGRLMPGASTEPEQTQYADGDEGQAAQAQPTDLGAPQGDLSTPF